MFQGFTKETSDFFWELMFNNERPWFLEHKEQFEQLVNRPFRALAAQTLQQLSDRNPELDFNMHISRIYRDARRLFGRGPYKDHLWFSIGYGDDWRSGPMFWFEIGAADYSYGVGFFDATAADMEAFRRSIDANPARFERIAAEVEKLKGGRLFGEEYKRPKGDKGELLNKWYNRRRLGLEFSHDFGEELYSSDLSMKLVRCYEKLMPLYDYFMQCHIAAAESGEEGKK